MTTTAAHNEEPIISLPTRRLLVTVCAAAIGTAGAWAALSQVIGAMSWSILEGVSGAAVVALVTVLGVLVIRPWKARTVTAWTTAWLAATVGRLLVTPALAYLLYSAAPLSLTPLMLSVAVTYVIVQFSEAAALALHLKRAA